MTIIDTDVLIWYFRGNENAIDIIRRTMPFSISSVTFMELIQGAKNKRAQKIIIDDILSWGTQVIHINENISVKAVQTIKEFSISHGIEVADALIASTVQENEGVLLTANNKHYRFISDLKIEVFRP